MKRTVMAVVTAGLLATGCGAGADGGSGLAWVGRPQVFKPAALPGDRVAVGKVRNTSGGDLALTSSEVVVRDATGRRLVSTAQFVSGYAHGLYGAYQKPSPVPPLELQRLGLKVVIPRGRTAPLTVSWSLPAGARLPVSVDYGRGTLELPTGVRAGAPGT